MASRRMDRETNGPTNREIRTPTRGESTYHKTRMERETTPANQQTRKGWVKATKGTAVNRNFERENQAWNQSYKKALKNRSTGSEYGDKMRSDYERNKNKELIRKAIKQTKSK